LFQINHHTHTQAIVGARYQYERQDTAISIPYHHVAWTRWLEFRCRTYQQIKKACLDDSRC
ncbi:unnamed protein product, partial [Musa hybrid cultivar]